MGVLVWDYIMPKLYNPTNFELILSYIYNLDRL
jgi:hypothetical protein